MAAKRKDGFYWVVVVDCEGRYIACVAWFDSDTQVFTLPHVNGEVKHSITALSWAAPYNRPIRPEDTIPTAILMKYKIPTSGNTKRATEQTLEKEKHEQA